MGHEWIRELAPGDKVIVHATRHELVVKVAKTTPTQVVLDFGNYRARFRMDSGQEISGDRWNHRWLEQATEDRVKSIEHEQQRSTLVHKIKEFDWRKASLPSLEAVNQIAQACEKPIAQEANG